MCSLVLGEPVLVCRDTLRVDVRAIMGISGIRRLTGITLLAALTGSCAQKHVPLVPGATMVALTIRDDAGQPLQARGRLTPDVGAAVECAMRDGRLACLTPAAGGATIHIELDGFVSQDRRITIGPEQGELLLERVRLADAGERGRLSIDGLVFRREDGSVFQWRGASSFLLYQKFLDRGSPVVGAVLVDLRTKPDGTLYAPGTGPNIVRVLGMVDSFSHFWPQEHADYYDKLAPFARVLAEYGFRLEFVGLADAQIIMPVRSDIETHLHRARDALAGEWNSQFLEASNESFKNLPAATEPEAETLAGDLGRLVRGPPMFIASGSYASDPVARYTLDYGTAHTRRDEGQWPRGSKDLLDYRDVTHTPWVADEPIGAAEGARPGSRATNPDDFAWYAATAALEGVGATFHSDAGIQSEPLGPVQRAAAEAFFWALTWVPADAQIAPYQRGGDAGTGGIGGMPIEHDDALELRSFCKQVSSDEYCVQIRTSRAHATPRDGWRIVEEPRRGFVRLAR